MKRRHTEPAAAEKPWFRSICRDKPPHKRGRCENCPPPAGLRRHAGANRPAATTRRILPKREADVPQPHGRPLRANPYPPFHSGVLLHIGPFFGSINSSEESRSRFSNRPDRVRQLIFKAYAVCCKTLFKSLTKRLDFFVISIGFYPKRIDKRARLAYNNSPKAR